MNFSRSLTLVKVLLLQLWGSGLAPLWATKNTKASSPYPSQRVPDYVSTGLPKDEERVVGWEEFISQRCLSQDSRENSSRDTVKQEVDVLPDGQPFSPIQVLAAKIPPPFQVDGKMPTVTEVTSHAGLFPSASETGNMSNGSALANGKRPLISARKPDLLDELIAVMEDQSLTVLERYFHCRNSRGVAAHVEPVIPNNIQEDNFGGNALNPARLSTRVLSRNDCEPAPQQDGQDAAILWHPAAHGGLPTEPVQSDLDRRNKPPHMHRLCSPAWGATLLLLLALAALALQSCGRY
jgi:hypothetical protein